MKYYFKCPNCKNDEQFTLPSERNSDLGCALLVFGGIIAALLYEESRRGRVQCGKCGLIFRQPRLPKTPVSRLASWVIWVMILSTFFTSFLITFPDLFLLIPEHAVISFIEAFVGQNSRAIAIGLVTMMILLLFVAIVASWFSSRFARKKLIADYHIKPTPFQLADPEGDKTGSGQTTIDPK